MRSRPMPVSTARFGSAGRGSGAAPPSGNRASNILAAAAEDTIRIGQYGAFTGKDADFGLAARKGVILAVEEANAAGGVLGKKIELLLEDNQSKQGESATIAKKLITRDKVIAILGEVASGRSLEAAPIAQANGIPMISPSSTNPKVTETGDYMSRA